MSISFEEALVDKLYNDVNVVANYVCGTLRKKASMQELKEHNDPTFPEIKGICLELQAKLNEYDGDVSRNKIERVEELINVIDDIISAISDEDNAMIVDCICHLDQFIEMHIQIEEV